MFRVEWIQSALNELAALWSADGQTVTVLQIWLFRKRHQS
jgi:hypothetical protein